MINKDKLTVLQITDTHLFAKDDSALFGVKTNANFYRVIEKIKKDIVIDKPDFFLLTGDLSQDESEMSYQKIVTALEHFNTPIYWIPGNHDDIKMMTQVFSQSPLFHHVRHLQTKHFDFVFLNTKLDGTDDGYLAKDELNALDFCLKEAQEKSIVVVMHHHPVKTNTPLIDQYILRNPDDFWNVMNQTSQVKLVMCGHVHGDYRLKKGDVNIEASPATCLQWEKGTTELNIERKIGYKLYRFSETTYSSEAKMWNE
jgi:Icc protein